MFLIINGISFLLSWIFLAILMTRYEVIKVLFILGLLAAAGLADHYLSIDSNPITIPLIILFWLSIGYVIQPDFFKKYRIVLGLIFGALLSFYFYRFLAATDYGSEDRVDFSNFMLATIPIIVALWGYEQWRWIKTLQSDKAQAELALLKSQINPHFFFNTLNNLYGLVVENSKQAPDVILKLSDMMRYTIYEGKKEKVSLEDEINYLKTYIELHKIRYQKEVDIQFMHQVDGTIQVAPLLFIILLENAFKHGVEKVRAHAYIHLDMKSEGKNITFAIKNNLVGSEAAHSHGIGLSNLRSRLAVIYPDSHELLLVERDNQFEAQLNLTIT